MGWGALPAVLPLSLLGRLVLCYHGEQEEWVVATIIQARGLIKRFKDITAVAGIDFSVETQECYGFLGPNGAGKTSTIKMISCLSPPTRGELLVAGKDVRRDGRAIKSTIGVVPQEDNLDPDLSVVANLMVYARYFDMPKALARERALEVLELFQLTERQNSRIDELSGGMKRRLIVARALIHQPSILILDEPTTGLDPQARHLVWQKLRYLKAQGITIVLTTHNMEEAAHLCDRVAIMDQGRIMAEGVPSALVSSHINGPVAEVHLDPSQKEAMLARLRAQSAGGPGNDIVIEDLGDVLYLFGYDGADLTASAAGLGHKLVLRPATLEDVFLRLTGRELRQ